METNTHLLTNKLIQCARQRFQQEIVNSMADLRDSINQRKMFVLNEPGLRCDVKTDHLNPKSVLPIFDTYINKVEIHLLEQPFDVFKKDIEDIIIKAIQQQTNEINGAKQLADAHLKVISYQHIVDEQYQKLMLQLIQEKKSDKEKLLEQNSKLKEQLYNKKQIQGDSNMGIYKPDFNFDTSKFGMSDGNNQNTAFPSTIHSDPSKPSKQIAEKLINMNIQISQANQHISDLQKKIDELKNELQQLQMEKVVMKQQNEEIPKMVDAMKLQGEQIFLLQQELNELNSASEFNGQDGNQLKQKIQELNNQLTQQEKYSNQTVEQLQQQLQQKQTDIDAIQKKMKQQQEQIASLHKQNQEQNQQNLQLKKNLFQAQSGTQDEGKLVSSLQQENEEKQLKIQQLEQQIEKLNMQIQSQQVQSSQLRSQMQQQLRQLNSQSTKTNEESVKDEQNIEQEDKETQTDIDQNSLENDSEMTIQMSQLLNASTKRSKSKQKEKILQSDTDIVKTGSKNTVREDSASNASAKSQKYKKSRQSIDKSVNNQIDKDTIIENDNLSQEFHSVNEFNNSKKPEKSSKVNISQKDNQSKSKQNDRKSSVQINNSQQSNRQNKNSLISNNDNADITIFETKNDSIAYNSENQYNLRLGNSGIAQQDHQSELYSQQQISNLKSNLENSIFSTISPQRNELQHIEAQLKNKQQTFTELLKTNVKDDQETNKRFVSADLLENLNDQHRLVHKYKQTMNQIVALDQQCLNQAENAISKYLNQDGKVVQTGVNIDTLNLSTNGENNNQEDDNLNTSQLKYNRDNMINDSKQNQSVTNSNIYKISQSSSVDAQSLPDREQISDKYAKVNIPGSNKLQYGQNEANEFQKQQTQYAITAANDILAQRNIKHIKQENVAGVNDVYQQLLLKKREYNNYVDLQDRVIKPYERQSVFETLNTATQRISKCSTMMVVSNQEFKKYYTMIGLKLVKDDNNRLEAFSSQSKVRFGQKSVQISQNAFSQQSQVHKKTPQQLGKLQDNQQNQQNIQSSQYTLNMGGSITVNQLK